MSKPTAKGFKSGFKAFAKGLGETLDAIAVAAEENRRVEAEARANVMQAIAEYESTTGRKWLGTTADISAANNMLPWDPERKGHLINCRASCRDVHCLVCGEWASTGPYCYNHRSR